MAATKKEDTVIQLTRQFDFGMTETFIEGLKNIKCRMCEKEIRTMWHVLVTYRIPDIGVRARPFHFELSCSESCAFAWVQRCGATSEACCSCREKKVIGPDSIHEVGCTRIEYSGKYTFYFLRCDDQRCHHTTAMWCSKKEAQVAQVRTAPKRVEVKRSDRGNSYQERRGGRKGGRRFVDDEGFTMS